MGPAWPGLCDLSHSKIQVLEEASIKENPQTVGRETMKKKVASGLGVPSQAWG